MKWILMRPALVFKNKKNAKVSEKVIYAQIN